MKSTVNSNPKFIGKSRLMLGQNKFIGGTYRNTTLDEQMKNVRENSAEIRNRAEKVSESNYFANKGSMGLELHQQKNSSVLGGDSEIDEMLRKPTLASLGISQSQALLSQPISSIPLKQ